MTPEEEQKKRIEEQNANNTADRILFRDPKKFADSTRIFIANGYFALRLNVGDEAHTFAMTPRTAKALAHFLNLQVSHYEGNIALIPFDLSVPTPLTPDELKNPDSDQSVPPSTEPPKPEKPPAKPKKKR